MSNRILVIANETVESDLLAHAIRAREASQVLIVAPALNGRVRHWTSDDDAAHAERRRSASPVARPSRRERHPRRTDGRRRRPGSGRGRRPARLPGGRARDRDAPGGPLELARPRCRRARAAPLRAAVAHLVVDRERRPRIPRGGLGVRGRRARAAGAAPPRPSRASPAPRALRRPTPRSARRRRSARASPAGRTSAGARTYPAGVRRSGRSGCRGRGGGASRARRSPRTAPGDTLYLHSGPARGLGQDLLALELHRDRRPGTHGNRVLERVAEPVRRRDEVSAPASGCTARASGRPQAQSIGRASRPSSIPRARIRPTRSARPARSPSRGPVVPYLSRPVAPGDRAELERLRLVEHRRPDARAAGVVDEQADAEPVRLGGDRLQLVDRQRLVRTPRGA